MDPRDNLGKICKCLEKYFNARTGKMEVKSRPVLVIGFEDTYDSPFKVDYEILHISTLKNIAHDPTYDMLLETDHISTLGLNSTSYVRTHKTSWSNVKSMLLDKPIGDLKLSYPGLYNEYLALNQKWVNARTIDSIVNPDTSDTV